MWNERRQTQRLYTVSFHFYDILEKKKNTVTKEISGCQGAGCNEGG